MQRRGQQGDADDVQPAGDVGQPQVEPTRRKPLITVEMGPAVAALITALSSLLLYSLAQVRHIDERLDKLEQEARVLMDGTGSIRPSNEALRSFFAIEHLKERVERLEGGQSQSNR